MKPKHTTAHHMAALCGDLRVERTAALDPSNPAAEAQNAPYGAVAPNYGASGAYDLKGLAGALGISRGTAARMLADGTLPGFKIGGRWRCPAEALRRWMLERCRRDVVAIEVPPYRSGRKARRKSA